MTITRSSIYTALAFAGATCLLCAPALFNGLPLLYSDSLEYMRSGDDVVSRLLGGPDTGAYGQRSILYSALIFLLHGNRTLWPVIAGNALVATYAIWLTARAVIPGFGPGRLTLLIAALAALTALPWLTSCVMPDIFAGVLILVLFLLGFATPPRRGWQCASLVLIGSLSIVVHPSHLLLAAAVAAGVSILQRLLGLPARQRLATAGALVATLALAVGATLSTSWLVRGKATLTGSRPPYLLARVIGDGTGRRFLEESCDRLDLAICAFADSLPSTSAGFLWGEDGPMRRATPGQARRIRREELAVVKGTLKAHPWEQLAASASNTARQLLRFGLQDFATNHSYVERTVPAIAPSPVDAYAHSRQRTRRLAWRRIDRVHRAFVAGSAVFCLLLISLRRVRRPWPSRQRRALVALAATSLVGVLANAAIAGTLSGPYHRYGARVIWLLPLVCALSGLALWRPRLRASNDAWQANA